MSFGSGVIQPRRSISPADISTLRGDLISHHSVGPIMAAADFFGLILIGAATGFLYDWLVRGVSFGRPIYIGFGSLAATLAVALLYGRGLYERSFVLSGSVVGAVVQVWLTVFAALAVAGFLLGWRSEAARP